MFCLLLRRGPRTENYNAAIQWSLSLLSEPKSAHLCRMVSFSLPQKILAQKCQVPKDVSVCLSSNLYIPSKRYSASFSTSIPSFVTQLEYSTLILNFYTQRLFSTSNQYIKRKVCASDVWFWLTETIQPPPNVRAPVSKNSEATLPWLAIFSLSLSRLQFYIGYDIHYMFLWLKIPSIFSDDINFLLFWLKKSSASSDGINFLFLCLETPRTSSYEINLSLFCFTK